MDNAQLETTLFQQSKLICLGFAMIERMCFELVLIEIQI